MFIQYENSQIELPEGSTAKDLAEKLNFRNPEQAIAVLINGKPLDLTQVLTDGDTVKFWHFEDKEGKEVFWHTSAHVLAQAILRIWPDALPTIGPPIENGFYYDFANLHVSEEDFPKIEQEIKNILTEGLVPKIHRFKNKGEAIKEFGKNQYKKELIEGFEEGSPITGYHQGEFFDLCRGPHLPTLGKIKAFKILKTSGAYWRGDHEKEMLTRLYGISFPSREQLKDYLFMLEEAKKRDHRLVGARLDLFSFKDEAPGMPFIHPKGLEIWDRLIQFWKERHAKAGYVLIKTPQMMSRELWEKSGHWAHYRENMFICPDDKDRVFAIKPMNCPGCMIYYKNHSHSYRELPLRVGEIGHVHRREPSGALNGLFRVQAFHQDDAHLFMQPSDIKHEILSLLKLSYEIYQTFGLTVKLELSTRPEKSIGSDETWEIATAGLKEALDEWGQPYRLNEGDGAFYGPKIDVHVFDALGRSWQCGTIQLDMALPEKFELEYKDSDGSLKRPIMLHRTIYGSIERFLAILIEHFAGKFPFWLSPLPIRIIPVTDRHLQYANKVKEEISQKGFICDIDDTTESVSKKVRIAQMLNINYMLTVGDKEVENETITLRTRDNVIHGEIKVEDFLTKITQENKERSLVSPFTQTN